MAVQIRFHRVRPILTIVAAAIAAAGVLAGSHLAEGASGLGISGPPSRIMIQPSPKSVTCGSFSNINALVTDSAGMPVPFSTTVTFRTTLGSITPATTGPLAVASLVIPPKTTGSAMISVSAGSATAQVTLPVTC